VGALAVVSEHLEHAADVLASASKTGLPLPAACALVEKESGGRNVFGRDAGGALAGFPGQVSRGAWEVFAWLVFHEGEQSNGVGPCQITSRDLLLDMQGKGLRPWVPGDNMRYGFARLKGYHDDAADRGSRTPWVDAGERYNGARSYGEDLAARRRVWIDRLAP
jgi:hypothetical protein